MDLSGRRQDSRSRVSAVGSTRDGRSQICPRGTSTHLPISIYHASIWSDDDLGIEDAFTVLCLVGLLVILGRVVDAGEEGDAQLLCESLEANLEQGKGFPTSESGDGQCE